MAWAESGEGQRADLVRLWGRLRVAPGALPDSPSSRCLPCTLICSPEWERLELPPACQQPR